MRHRQLSPSRALWYFGFKQTRRGALILGLMIAGILTIQGFGYNAAYPTEQSRTQLAASMQEAPAFGILYGEPENLSSTTGYMAYRVVAFFGFIAAIWALSTVTRLLRGQEEDGHWEHIAAGSITTRRASKQLLLGFGMSLLLAFVMSTLVTFIACRGPEINATLAVCTHITMAVFLPAVLFAALGLFTSQLSFARHRAMMYGLVPLLGFFAMRALGNTIDDIYWLKQFTPFGWSELLRPASAIEWVWLVPFVVAATVLISLGIYLVGLRDTQAGLFHESSVVRSRFYLLGSATQLALRENMGLFLGWAITTISVSAIIATASSVAVDSLADSPGFQAIIGRLGGSLGDLKVALMGTGLIFTTVILLLMATTSLAAIRTTELKNYLDNLLTQPLRRSAWLVGRLLIIIVAFTLTSIVCGVATWLMAQRQGIPIELGDFLIHSIALTGTVVFTLGIGTLLYGLLPRIAVVIMYSAIAWSFIIDVIGSVVDVPTNLSNTSLLHYISRSLSQAPDWSTFAWLVTLGIGMMSLGIITFTRRDIVSE
jgi:ABC-2 type transport system permease protein